MTEYTATEVRELVAGLPVLKIEAGAEASEVEALRDALEGADQLVRELPKGERAEALVDDAQVVGRSLWVPVVKNCRLSAGLSLSGDDELSFAVKGDGDELVEYFSAREAMMHVISGAAQVRGQDLPAPEENGRNTRKAAATRTVAAPDASGVSCKDLIPQEDESRDRAPDADVDRDDVASDGLGQPAGGVRYLGVGPSLEDPAETAPAVRGTRGVHPDWRVRLSCLILARRLPSGATGDVVRLIEFLGEVEATPDEFVRTLAAWRAALSGEDLAGLSKLDGAGALPASEFSTGCVRRLAEGERASVRRVHGELLLVSRDPDRPGRALVADALKAAREVRELQDADEAFRLSERVRTELSARPRRPATLEAIVSTIAPLCGGREGALREVGKLVRGGTLSAHWSGGRVFLSMGEASPEDLARASRLADDAQGQARANKKATARARRDGKMGLSSRLEADGAPEDVVRFWRSFEYKEGRPGEFKAAFAAPVVPYGGTPVDPQEQPEILRLERARVAARDSGRVSAEVTLAGEWGYRLYRFGRTVCARLTMLSRRSRLFLSAHAAHCWPEQDTEVLFDPDGSFDAQVAEERVAAGKAPTGMAPKAGAIGATDWADRLPKAEVPSGPDPEGSYAKRSRDPFAAERRGEPIIATKSGKALAPSLRPRQRERAKRRVAAIVRDGGHRATKVDDGAGPTKELRALRDRALLEHLAALPVAERLELYLALYGPKEISVLKERAADPTGLLLAACELKRAGRIEIEDGRMSAPALGEEEMRELNSRLAAIARPSAGAA